MFLYEIKEKGEKGEGFNNGLMRQSNSPNREFVNFDKFKHSMGIILVMTSDRFPFQVSL